MTTYLQSPASLAGYVLERAGCPIHYWLGGPADRPLIAFMHGATMDHRMFNDQVEALVDSYRVLVWDARGHGQSTPIGDGFTLEMCARDMLAILDDINVEQAIFCGQSLGGYIAQHIYLQAPERVLALIIIGSTPIAKPYSKLEMWALKGSLPLFNLWPYDNFTTTLANRTANSEPVRAYALEASRSIDRDDFLTIWKAVTVAVDEKGRPGLTLEVPLLLVHGDEDKTGTIRRDMPVWAEQEPKVTYQVIPDAAHNANQDNPEFTNAVITNFLQSEGFAPAASTK